MMCYPLMDTGAAIKEAEKGFSLHACTQSTHTKTEIHVSAESLSKSAHQKLNTV